VDDKDALLELNSTFIDAWRRGSWETIDPILASSFEYLDGQTGKVANRASYASSLRSGAAPTIEFDEVRIHVVDDTAIVSARTTRDHSAYRRYVDTYARIDDRWLCVHACVWHVQ
jgi:hypothetical protein